MTTYAITKRSSAAQPEVENAVDVELWIGSTVTAVSQLRGSDLDAVKLGIRPTTPVTRRVEGCAVGPSGRVWAYTSTGTGPAGSNYLMRLPERTTWSSDLEIAPDIVITIPATLDGVSVNWIQKARFLANGDVWLACPNGVWFKYTAAQLAATGSPAPAVVVTVNPASLGGGYGPFNDFALTPAGDLLITMYGGAANGGLFRLSAAQIATSGNLLTPAAVFGGSTIGHFNARGISGIELTPDGTQVATACFATNEVAVWNVSDLQVSGNPAPARAYTCPEFVGPHQLAYHPTDGSLWFASLVTSNGSFDPGQRVGRITRDQLGSGGAKVASRVQRVSCPGPLAFARLGVLWLSAARGAPKTRLWGVTGPVLTVGGAAPTQVADLTVQENLAVNGCALVPEGVWAWTESIAGNRTQFLLFYTREQLLAGGGAPTRSLELPVSRGIVRVRFVADGAWVFSWSNYLWKLTSAQLAAGGVVTPDKEIRFDKTVITGVPNDLALDAAGNAYLSWYGENGAESTLTKSNAASLVSSSASLAPDAVVGGLGSDNRKSYSGMALDPDGARLWVAGYEVDSVYCYTLAQLGTSAADPAPSVVLTSEAFNGCSAVQFGGSNLWVSNFDAAGKDTIVMIDGGQLASGGEVTPSVRINGAGITYAWHFDFER